MRRVELLEFECPINGDTRDYLAELGAYPHGDHLNVWVLPPTVRADEIRCAPALADSETHVSYEIWPEPGTDLGDQATYLALSDLSELDDWTHDTLVMAFDDDGSTRLDRAVGTPAVVALLEPHTDGLRWTLHPSDSRLRVLSDVVGLSEPVRVPAARRVAPNTVEGGPWYVHSDGREVLSRANLRFTRRHGIVRSRECDLGDRVVTWSRPLIVSGFLLDLLTRHDVRGVFPHGPSFLDTDTPSGGTDSIAGGRLRVRLLDGGSRYFDPWSSYEVFADRTLVVRCGDDHESFGVYDWRDVAVLPW